MQKGYPMPTCEASFAPKAEARGSLPAGTHITACTARPQGRKLHVGVVWQHPSIPPMAAQKGREPAGGTL